MSDDETLSSLLLYGSTPSSPLCVELPTTLSLEVDCVDGIHRILPICADTTAFNLKKLGAMMMKTPLPFLEIEWDGRKMKDDERVLSVGKEGGKLKQTVSSALGRFLLLPPSLVTQDLLSQMAEEIKIKPFFELEILQVTGFVEKLRNLLKLAEGNDEMLLALSFVMEEISFREACIKSISHVISLFFESLRNELCPEIEAIIMKMDEEEKGKDERKPVSNLRFHFILASLFMEMQGETERDSFQLIVPQLLADISSYWKQREKTDALPKSLFSLSCLCDYPGFFLSFPFFLFLSPFLSFEHREWNIH
jgi:hypothetical protein